MHGLYVLLACLLSCLLLSAAAPCETAAETKIALSKLKESITNE